MKDDVDGLLQEVLSLAPASQWSFARVNKEGVLSHVIVAGSPNDVAWHRQLLRAEYVRAREGSRRAEVGDTGSSLIPYRYGLTACFAHDDSVCGLLVMVRTKEMGAFQSTERRRLGTIVPKIAAKLGERRAGGRASATFVVDDSLRVQNNEPQIFDIDGPLATHLFPVGGGLPPLLADTVGSLIDGSAAASGEGPACIAIATLALEVHVMPLGNAYRVWVFAKQTRDDEVLSVAALRYGLSEREVDVLELLLEGESTAELGDKLNIAEATAREHIKHLLEKTGSRNRVEVAAKVLGFRSGANAFDARRRA